MHTINEEIIKIIDVHCITYLYVPVYTMITSDLLHIQCFVHFGLHDMVYCTSILQV